MSSIVKDIRKQLGMTQTEFGAKIGVPYLTVLFWEKGKRKISPDFAKKIAQYATYAGIPTTLDDIYGMPKKAEKTKNPSKRGKVNE